MHSESNGSSSGRTLNATVVEKPRNGLAGLKHWRHDLVAGLLVSLISLPFSLGIAVASGAPPIAGLVSAIIAGLLIPFLGGSYVTVSGPAAGLAPILLASMTALGRGDLEAGYPLLLCAIFIAGLIQIVLARFRMARFCVLFPSSVIEGMLASIGLLIIAKQLPNFIGRSFHAHEFFEYVREFPGEFMQLNPQVFLIGASSLAIIFGLSALKQRWVKIVPPQVLAVAFATALARLLEVDSSYLIHIPENPLAQGIVTPDFAGLFADASIWSIMAVSVVTLTLTDSVESLATVLAIDKIDPFHRKSDPNRTLLAMGIAKICASLAGGLTIIPGGVKSKACIVGGGRTLWAGFYNALFLLAFLFLARPVINLIPLSALAAVLIFTGYKLCEPRIWRHVSHIGREQLFVFSVTVLATLCTDLLWGIIVGMAAKFLLAAWLTVASDYRRHVEDIDNGGTAPRHSRLAHARSLAKSFRNPVARQESRDDGHYIYFHGPLFCFNLLHVNKELAKSPVSGGRVVLHLTEGVTVVDHTSCENLLHFAEASERNGTAQVEIIGMERMSAMSEFPSSMRLRYVRAVRSTRNVKTANGTAPLAGETTTGSKRPLVSSAHEYPGKPAWFEIHEADRHPEDPGEYLSWVSLCGLSASDSDSDDDSWPASLSRID